MNSSSSNMEDVSIDDILLDDKKENIEEIKLEDDENFSSNLSSSYNSEKI